MNKHRYEKIIFFGIILTAVFWYGWTQAQPVNSESEQNSSSKVGRDDPFANFFSNEKSTAQKVSQTSQIVGEKPELFLETITLKSLGAESFKAVIEGMSSSYGSVSIDKNSNTLIIYDTKEALAKMKELVPPREIVTENRVSKSYRIVYSNIDEVEKTLRTFISNNGQLSANPSTGNILVVDFESNIKVIDNFVKEIDRLMQQVLVEVRIYDVTTTDGFDIGAEWDAGRNNPITTFTPNTEADNIVTNNLTGVTTTDTTTINTTKVKQTAWQDSDAGVVEHSLTVPKTYTYRKSNPFVGGSFSADTAGTIRLGLLDTVNVDIALNILRTQVGAKLLANPRILVLDNETAEFKIIRQIPYTEVSTTSAGTDIPTVKFKDVGTELKVTPHITREGMIRLDISPEFGVRVGSTTPPTVDTRKINTKALVKDGQTVVLGGLRKREVSQDISKIPILGDVPLLGALFTEVSESVTTSELLIFITPRIVAEPTLSAGELKGLEATDFSDPKIADTEYEKAEK
jgi:type IV pilus assembly protein PilQ